MPYLTGTRGNSLEGHKICINDETLELVNVYTYLGIRLDSRLTMKNHLDHLYRAATSMVFSLSHIRKYIDTNTAILIFKAHILSRIEYGNVLCIGANNTELERLQKLINKGLRICLLKPCDANVYNMHIEAKLFPQSIRRNIALMKLMFGITLDENPNVSSAGERVRTRGDDHSKIMIPFPRSSWFHRSVSYQVPSRWLALPKSLNENDGGIL